MKSHPTIIDVAAHAGVSRQTVSRVINNKDEVHPDTRARVLASIEALGYRPNAIARSMVAGRTRTLGCIAPNLTDYSYASMIESAQNEARQQGYFVLTGSAPTDTDAKSLLKELLQRQIDGLLVVNPLDHERWYTLQPTIEDGFNLVYLGCAPRDTTVSVVRCDDKDGGYTAAHYLLDLGHVSMATICGPNEDRSAYRRLAGWQQSLDSKGVQQIAELVGYGDWSADSGYEATIRFLDNKLPFTAIFAHNDRMAVGAIHALVEKGYRVPDDVSVIGFDDIPLAVHYSPPLTTLRQPFEEIGRQAAQLLIRALEDPGQPPVHLQLRAELVVRQSTQSDPLP